MPQGIGYGRRKRTKRKIKKRIANTMSPLDALSSRQPSAMPDPGAAAIGRAAAKSVTDPAMEILNGKKRKRRHGA